MGSLNTISIGNVEINVIMRVKIYSRVVHMQEMECDPFLESFARDSTGHPVHSQSHCVGRIQLLEEAQEGYVGLLHLSCIHCAPTEPTSISVSAVDFWVISEPYAGDILQVLAYSLLWESLL